MEVKDIMKKDFVSFQADDKLEDIVKTMAKHKITSAPVLDDGEYIGVVSDIGIAEYFMPKKFAFLWIKSKPTPLEDIKKVTARKLAKKAGIVLKPEQKLLDVLPAIVKKPDCIAVLDKGRLVGIVSGDDITNFFLKELAKGEIAEKQEEFEENKSMNTEVDAILAIVQRDGEVPAAKIAKELGISLGTAEKLGESLSRHHLIEIKYSFLKGAVFRRFSHGKI